MLYKGTIGTKGTTLFMKVEVYKNMICTLISIDPCPGVF